MREDTRGPQLLALLALADMNGDELTEALQDWSGDALTAGRIEVGETLDRLAHDGLITVVTRRQPLREPDAPEQQGPVASVRTTATYALTQAGREALAAWLAGGDEPTTPPRPELLARVLLSLPAGRDRALEVITRQRRGLVAALQRRRRAVREAASGRDARERLERRHDPLVSSDDELRALPAVLVEDARFTQAEAELRWLDLCEARLDGGGAA